jgi:hypothetical protein
VAAATRAEVTPEAAAQVAVLEAAEAVSLLARPHFGAS